MINVLSGYGRDSAKNIQASLNLEIEEVTCISDLHFKFTDGSSLLISDEGQSCCESRYLVCDDDLSSFKGAKILSIQEEDGGVDDGDEYGKCHESVFIKVQTSNGPLTCAAHVEHNGYYGGFSLVATRNTPEGSEDQVVS